MTIIQSFCRSGEQEEFKGAVHAAAGMLALVMATYNATAWWYRHQGHLGANAIIYSVVVAWELKQTMHHLQRCVCEEETARAA